jgi:hypothetical protein
MRKLMLAAALAAVVPATVHAAPMRTGHPTSRSEAMGRSGIWIGALVFLLAAALVLAAYSGSGDGPPASP